jgi:single-stranded DNA-binding protein
MFHQNFKIITPFKLTVCQDVKTTTFESGKTVIEFSIAENHTYRSNGEKVTDTTWHECKLWSSGDSVQIADYL